MPPSPLRASSLLVGALLAPLALVPPIAAGAERDPFWRVVREDAMAAGASERILMTPQHRVLSLDSLGLRGHLAGAPLEDTVAARTTTLVVTLPMPDGGFERFRVQESPIMEPELAAQYPEIRTYRGWGIDDPTASARFDWTSAGFHGMVLGSRGTVYIDPWAKGDTQHYVSYFKRDYRRSMAPQWRCGTTGSELVGEMREMFEVPQMMGPFGATKRTYRLALAATGEYTAFQGGTKALALAAIATTMNRVNGIYEREVAVHMNLIANDNLIIYTNGGTDPYTNSDSECGSPGCAGSLMLTQNQTNLGNVIGSANYDIGHVFSTGGGGVAGLGVVCDGSFKAWGVTGSGSPVGDGFDVDYVAHEMGHQFDANHTFNGTSGSCNGNRNASTAFEPGSGSTIMAYAGICGAEDLQPHSDDYFHAGSLDEIQPFIFSGSGSTCAAASSSGDNPPNTPNAGSAHTIPKQTPFTLTASGTDPDGDALTFDWEEMDLGAAAPPNTDNGNRAIFRSFDPDTPVSPSRTLPKLARILTPPSNCESAGGFECLPTTSRAMSFRVTARDNRFGTNSATTTVTSSSTSGPFAVTAPNTSVTWAGGSTQAVTWSVNGTSGAPVSCANVQISLSTDGGTTFPTVILASTPNDGTENITVPSVATTQARIQVDSSACGNIFFDISNTNFTITASAQPTFAIDDVTLAEGNAGSTNAVFTVTLSPAATGTVNVDFATANGTATAGSDYTTNSGTLTFGTGQTSQTLAVAVLGDVTDEPNETFNVNLSNATAGTTIGDATGVGTITDDDPAPGISINDVAQSEGNAGSTSAVFTATLSNPSSATVTVAYATANGTATAGSDYTAASGTLSFAPGTTTRTLGVPILGDGVYEPDEGYVVNLSSPANATIADSQGAGTILNDDPLPSLAINDVTVAEGDAGNVAATFTVSLSNLSGQAVTVGYATADGSASAGSDYVAASGTLTIPAGSLSGPLTVQVKGDLILETDETFVVNLSGATNATIGDSQGVGTIQDDDALPSLQISDVTVTEGNTGTVNAVFAVTLSATSGSTVSVNYATANGSALAGLDYIAMSGTLSFAPGSTADTISVPVKGDTRREANEAFLVALSGPVNAKLGRSRGQGTILDDDRPVPDPCLPIVTAPITLSSPGCYFLGMDVTTPAAGGAAITIGADAVRVDLRGHVLRGTAGAGTQAVGIASSDRKNVTIGNGTVRGFFEGIALRQAGPYTSPQGLLIQRVTARDNTYTGIEVEGMGNSVLNNSVAGTQGSTAFGADADARGIVATGPGARVTGNLVTDTRPQGAGMAFGIDLTGGDGAKVQRNRISNPTLVSSTGIRATASTGVTVTLNRLTTLDFGVVFAGGTTGTAANNTMINVGTPYVP